VKTVCRYCLEVVHGDGPDDLTDALRDHYKADCALHPRYGVTTR
jgi:hypothetical protein